MRITSYDTSDRPPSLLIGPHLLKRLQVYPSIPYHISFFALEIDLSISFSAFLRNSSIPSSLRRS